MFEQSSSNLPKANMMSRSNLNLIAVCQMTSTSDIEANYKTCEQLVHRASQMGAEMTFLPEGCDFISKTKEEAVAMAISLDGELMSRYKNLAMKYDQWLSLGGVHLKEDGNMLSNAHILIDNFGKIIAVYKKTHLFDVDIPNVVRLKETDQTIPGTRLISPVRSPVGSVGMAICYDMRFPELSIALTKRGADILTFPSAFTQTTGMAHWEVLLRSRAIENQCYVAAAAQTGKHNEKRTSYGHAMIVDPWGTILACCREGADVCVANVDHDYIQQVRKRMPVWEHRRHDIYGTVLFNGDKL
ncbi:deaminated glutathione amidase-like isoform X1 [Antedon mediterranea]|uniref:deaminated glutathione amidase-like isoform X1 n=1 Tax=Antedon mediterranea TaxID=105859 RepID=UPI003AF4DF54